MTNHPNRSKMLYPIGVHRELDGCYFVSRDASGAPYHRFRGLPNLDAHEILLVFSDQASEELVALAYAAEATTQIATSGREWGPDIDAIRALAQAALDEVSLIANQSEALERLAQLGFRPARTAGRDWFGWRDRARYV